MTLPVPGRTQEPSSSQTHFSGIVGYLFRGAQANYGFCLAGFCALQEVGLRNGESLGADFSFFRGWRDNAILYAASGLEAGRNAADSVDRTMSALLSTRHKVTYTAEKGREGFGEVITPDFSYRGRKKH